MDATRILKRKILLFAAICLLSFAGMFLVNSYNSSRNELDENKRSHFEKILRTKEQKLQQVLQLALTEEFNREPFESLHITLEPELWQKEGITLFLYKNDSLIYWSNNNVPADNLSAAVIFPRGDPRANPLAPMPNPAVELMMVADPDIARLDAGLVDNNVRGAFGVIGRLPLAVQNPYRL